MRMSLPSLVLRTLGFFAGLGALAAPFSTASGACNPLVVYTKNLQRSITPIPPEGPLANQVVVNGLIYETPTEAAPSIGTFDLSAIVTSVNNENERRQVFIETAFDPAYVNKLIKEKKFCQRLIMKKPVDPDRSHPDDIDMTGVETYPLGGGILTTPVVFGISAGDGRFIGVKGSVRITFDPATQFFTYTFTFV